MIAAFVSLPMQKQGSENGIDIILPVPSDENENEK